MKCFGRNKKWKDNLVPSRGRTGISSATRTDGSGRRTNAIGRTTGAERGVGQRRVGSPRLSSMVRGRDNLPHRESQTVVVN